MVRILIKLYTFFETKKLHPCQEGREPGNSVILVSQCSFQDFSPLTIPIPI